MKIHHKKITFVKIILRRLK